MSREFRHNLALNTGRLETPEAEAAEAANSLWIYSSAGDQHLKILSHSRRCHQMFELQSHFCSLLRQAAVFEGVGKLIFFAYA